MHDHISFADVPLMLKDNEVDIQEILFKKYFLNIID